MLYFSKFSTFCGTKNFKMFFKFLNLELGCQIQGIKWPVSLVVPVMICYFTFVVTNTKITSHILHSGLLCSLEG